MDSCFRSVILRLRQANHTRDDSTHSRPVRGVLLTPPGVDPPPWTPQRKVWRGSRWQRRRRSGTHRSLSDRWWIWCAAAERRRSPFPVRLFGSRTQHSRALGASVRAARRRADELNSAPVTCREGRHSFVPPLPSRSARLGWVTSWVTQKVPPR